MTDRSYLKKVALRSLHMHACRHERGESAPTAEMEFVSQGSVQPSPRPEAGRLAYLVTVQYSFGGLLDEGSPSPNEVAQGEVSFLATYEVEGEFLDDDQIADFAYNGVLFQVHPYLREHLASMCQRSGLPTFQLPLLFRGRQEDDDAFVGRPSHQGG